MIHQTSKVTVISRSILLSCLVIHECSFIDKMEHILKCDFRQKLSECLKKIIKFENIDESILDVTLEGLSYIWIKYPDQILGSEG